MSFTTFTFAFFFVITGILYYICPARWQNGVLLAANLVFYLWNSPAAALILIVAALSAYWAGRYTQAHPGSKLAVWMICLLLFGMLFVYKYLNFFSGSRQT